jgi:uncharacterized protein (TIGR00369 family)
VSATDSTATDGAATDGATDIRERIVRWADPVASAEILRGMSGLEGMRAMMEGRVPPPPIAATMNLRLAEVEEGRVVFVGDPGEFHYNPIGVVHGGFALTLADSALGCSIHTMLPAGVGYTSTDVQLRFVRPITVKTGPVRCEARAIHVGRSSGISEAKLTDSQGKLLATASTACMIFRP